MAKLRVAMANFDGESNFFARQTTRLHKGIVDAIKAFRFQPEKEDYVVPADDGTNDAQMDVDIDPALQTQLPPPSTAEPKMKSNLRMFPPPLFSRQGVPINYKYVGLHVVTVIPCLIVSSASRQTRPPFPSRW